MDGRRPVQKVGVHARKVGDEWILYDTGDGSVHVVNATAARVWDLCDGGHSVADMERALREAYTVPEDASVAEGVTAVIEQFTRLGLVTFAEP